MSFLCAASGSVIFPGYLSLCGIDHGNVCARSATVSLHVLAQIHKKKQLDIAKKSASCDRKCPYHTPGKTVHCLDWMFQRRHPVGWTKQPEWWVDSPPMRLRGCRSCQYTSTSTTGPRRLMRSVAWLSAAVQLTTFHRLWGLSVLGIFSTVCGNWIGRQSQKTPRVFLEFVVAADCFDVRLTTRN